MRTLFQAAAALFYKIKGWGLCQAAVLLTHAPAVSLAARGTALFGGMARYIATEPQKTDQALLSPDPALAGHLSQSQSPSSQKCYTPHRHK